MAKRKPDPCAGCEFSVTERTWYHCSRCARAAMAERDAWRDMVYQFAEDWCGQRVLYWAMALAMEMAKRKAGR